MEDKKVQSFNQRYELHIGVTFNIELGVEQPKQKMNISEEQFLLIETFASTFKDKDLNTVYKLNDCEFRVYPVFEPKRNFKL